MPSRQTQLKFWGEKINIPSSFSSPRTGDCAVYFTLEFTKCLQWVIPLCEGGRIS